MRFKNSLTFFKNIGEFFLFVASKRKYVAEKKTFVGMRRMRPYLIAITFLFYRDNISKSFLARFAAVAIPSWPISVNARKK